MKKLVLFLLLTTLSFGSMAMGYPHSTFSQQRTLLSKTNKINFTPKVSQAEADLTSVVDTEKSSFFETLVENISNFFVNIFSSLFSSHDKLAVNHSAQLIISTGEYNPLEA